MHGPSAAAPRINPADLSIYAVEVIERLNETIAAVATAYGEYEFNVVAQRLYDFVWSDYCDWFVEAAKTDIFEGDARQKATALAVMDHVLSAVLRLLHPFMPHVTEELWSTFGFGEGSIQFAAPPQPLSLKGDVTDKRALVETVYEVVQAGRNLRAEGGVSTNQKAKFVFRSNNSTLGGEQPTIARLLNASELLLDPSFQGKPGTPVAMTRAGELFLAIDVDPTAERGRLDKEIAKLEAELRAAEAKLTNKSFVDRAPAAVVEEHRERQKKFGEQLAKLKEARARL
jgi:valyl-tRNA synthetase